MKNATVIDFIAYRKQQLSKAGYSFTHPAVSEELILEIKNLIERLRAQQPRKCRKN